MNQNRQGRGVHRGALMTTIPMGITNWGTIVDEAFSEVYNDARSCYREPFPPMNVSVDNVTGTLILEFALAGYSQEEVNLTIEGDTIKLDLTRTIEEKEPDVKYFQHGIKSANISKKYVLPSGKFDLEAITADFVNGILKITCPVAQNMKPRQLLLKKSDKE